MVSRITAAEREALRLFDMEIDMQPMTAEDYRLTDFVESLLFPEIAKEHEKRNARDARRKAKQTPEEREAQLAKQRAYYKANRERIRERKAKYYRENQERISAAQKDYRQRRSLSLAAAIA